MRRRSNCAGVHVLELVDQDVAELPAQRLEECGARPQEPDRLRDQIAEIGQAGLFQPLLVCEVDRRQPAHPRAALGLRLEQQVELADLVLLRERDEGQGILGEDATGSDRGQLAELFLGHGAERLAHADLLSEAVDQRADGRRLITPQETRAEAVEGADPGLGVGVSEARVDAAPDLLGGRGREREHEHRAAVGRPTLDQLPVEVTEQPRLPGPQDRPGCGRDRPAPSPGARARTPSRRWSTVTPRYEQLFTACARTARGPVKLPAARRPARAR